MKRIINFIIIPCVLLGFLSCEDEDKFPYKTREEIKLGAFFRTVANSGTINKNDIANSSYSVTGELVTEEEVSSVDFMVSYIDRNTEVSDDSVDPVLVESKPISAFTTNSNGFPESSFNIEASNALTLLGINESIIDGGDQLVFSFAINMSDGSTYAEANSGDSVKGELFFQSPLTYVGTVVCLAAPKSGEWILNMTDLYGDGWDGAKITVNLDGALTDYTVSGGSGQIETIVVPPGSTMFTFTYTSGSFEEEHVYTLTDPDGSEVINDGPNPTTGELLNKCL